MARQIDLSVIIPTLGLRTELFECIDSCLMQDLTHSQYEVIVVDHPAKLSTQEFVTSRQGQFANIKYLGVSQKGTNQARNLGAEMASGKFLLFIDDDCRLSDGGYLRKLINKFANEKSLVGCGGYYSSAESDPAYVKAYNTMSNAWAWCSQDISDTAGVLIGGCCAYEREAFFAVGGFDVNQHGAGEEIRLNQKLREKNAFLKLDPELNIEHRFVGGFRRFIKSAYTHGYGQKLGKTDRSSRWRNFQNFTQRGPDLSKNLGWQLGYVGLYWLGIKCGEIHHNLKS